MADIRCYGSIYNVKYPLVVFFSRNISISKGMFWFKERARATNGKLALSICLKMKMIEKVLKSDNSANESLLILCL